VTDPTTAFSLQTTYQVSALINQPDGIQLRLISPTRPHEAAELVAPSLEDAYLLATGQQKTAA
jgi:ABC-2 type transport system ATP-binding protein